MPVRAGIAPCRLEPAARVFQAARADPAGGEIHHPGEGRVVIPIGNQAQIGQGVLDFLAFEKAQTAIHPVRQTGGEQGMFEHTRLGIAAIEQGDLAAGVAVAGERLDFLDDPARLVQIGTRLEYPDRLAGTGLGPQVLAQALRIVLDDGIGRIEDVAVGTVVLLQTDHVLHMEFTLEVAHIAHLGATERINALVIIADAEQAGAAAGKQLQPFVLKHIGILKLIHQNMPEAFLVVPPQRLVALQQLIRAQQQLGEVDHPFALALGLIGRIQLDPPPRPVVPGFDRCRAQALLLLRVDEILQIPRRIFFVIHIERLEQALDRGLLVGGIENLEQLGQARVAVMAAQQAVAQAVEGADPHAPHIDRQHRRKAGEHLLGRLVGKGHREQAGRRDLAGGHQPGDAGGQYAGLARAGAGQNQPVLWRQSDSGQLFGIKAGKKGGHPRIIATAPTAQCWRGIHASHQLKAQNHGREKLKESRKTSQAHVF